MKFYKLFKKEIKELLTLQALVGIVVIAVMFFLLGNVISSVTKDLVKSDSSVVVCDLDKSEISKGALAFLDKNGMKTIAVNEMADTELVKVAKEHDHSVVLVIPKGFGEGILSSKPQTMRTVAALTSFALTSDNDPSANNAIKEIGNYISAEVVTTSGFDTNFIKNPVVAENTTVVGEKATIADPDMLKNFGMSQSMFIPIIVFLLITFAVQLNSAAIANEKTDKTLETLLSAPVSRLDVIGSKMAASAVYSLLMAAVFIVGYAMFMGNMTSGMSAGMQGSMDLATGGVNMSTALSVLGIKLSGVHFALLGIQLFLTIAIALTISMILGALAKDLKSAQGLITPIMFATMIPYFITMFTDINALPTVARVLIYAIPFTHTFAATGNVLFGGETMFYIGLAYQAIWLVGVVWVAVRVFSTDKIFTASIEFGKKKTPKAKTKVQA